MLRAHTKSGVNAMKQEQTDVTRELRDPVVPPVRGLQSGGQETAPRSARPPQAGGARR